MTHRRRLAALAAATLIGFLIVTISAANPGVTLIGTGFIAGNATDLSGLADSLICQSDPPKACIDRATLGGLGSGLAFTGHDNVFLALPDRGPFDGRTDVPYFDRFHFLHITVDTTHAFPNITTVLLDTRLLKNEQNENFVGNAFGFDPDDQANPLKTVRFDPEGVALSADGHFFISDEYGPYILEFDRQGHLLRRIAVPEKFLLKTPPAGSASGLVDAGGNSLELGLNTFGRQANRGMEGLAITPDGRQLVGIMQNALLQDFGWDVATASRVGFNNRILTFDLVTGETHEYVYTMDTINQGKGVNEILAINDHEFLVLERDNRTGVPDGGSNPPNTKKIFKIDLDQDDLTDVTDMDLPKTVAELGPLNIVPVTKTLVINMLDDSYVVNSATTPTTKIRNVIAEKIEGMAWGPDLPDGRHVLYVMSDNDLNTSIATQIYAFAIDGAAAHIDYQPQQLPEPLFAPGQLRQLLK